MEGVYAHYDLIVAASENEQALFVLETTPNSLQTFLMANTRGETTGWIYHEAEKILVVVSGCAHVMIRDPESGKIIELDVEPGGAGTVTILRNIAHRIDAREDFRLFAISSSALHDRGDVRRESSHLDIVVTPPDGSV